MNFYQRITKKGSFKNKSPLLKNIFQETIYHLSLPLSISGADWTRHVEETKI